MLSHDVLDYWTQVSLDSIWKAQVAQCIEATKTGLTFENNTGSNDIIENYEDDDWVFIDNTIISEPFWGQVVNRN